MTVWDNVAYGPRSMKKDKAEVTRRVDEILEIVRLTDFAKRKPAQLSGGQQQRVALARALVNYPSALLLDEPLGALDLKLRHAMQFELKRIQREVGITFVYVTHDQEEALTMSDRIAVMNAGQRRTDRHPDRHLRRAVDGVRRQLHRPGQPLGGHAEPARRRHRRGLGPRHHVAGATGHHPDRERRPGHPDGAARTRPGLGGRNRRGDVVSVRATVTRSDLPGPGRAALTRRAGRLADRRARRPRTAVAAAAPRRRGVRLLATGGLAGPCPPPTSPPPRISRRCSTPPTRPDADHQPTLLRPRKSERHSPAMANQINPGLISQIAGNRSSPSTVPRRRCRCRSGFRARPVLPRRMRLQQHDEFQQLVGGAGR